MASRLDPLPAGFESTRNALHRVAERIVSPARKPDNEISLRVTPEGLGTPQFEFEGASVQVRVEGAELVRERDGTSSRTPLTTLKEAGQLVADLLPADLQLDDQPLDIDADAALCLGAWFQLGATVLEELRSEAGPKDEPTSVRIWPEHFDIAIELGSKDGDARANYGFSPGDDEHPEPYLYVGPWSGEVSGDLWNATSFKGAELGYADLQAEEDPLAMGLEFCRVRKRALEGTEPA